MKEREIIRYQRYRGYDYSRGAVLFITIVTEPRRAVFGRVRNAVVELSYLGQEVEKSLVFAAAHTTGLRLYEHVVMPDHIHFRVYLEPGLAEPLKTLGGFIRRFKTWTTRVAKLALGHAGGFEQSSNLKMRGSGVPGVAGSGALGAAGSGAAGAAGSGATGAAGSGAPGVAGRGALGSGAAGSGAPGAPGSSGLGGGAVARLESRALRGGKGEGGLWQQGYHDWICLSKEMIDAVIRYIIYNPLKYELRYNLPAFLAIHEPLRARRLSPLEFWRGIGAVGLLNGERPFIALRISRRLSARQVAEAVTRIRRRVGDFTFIGGWISPGEKAVRDMLLRDPSGQIVEILPSAMPHDYKVGSMWLPAIRDGRAAIIARGNSEIEFSRAACLEVNEAARGIAELELAAGLEPGFPSAAGLEPGSQDGGTPGSGTAPGSGAPCTPGSGGPGSGTPGSGTAPGSDAPGTPGSGGPGGGAVARLESRALRGDRGMAIYWLPDGPHIIPRRR